MREVSSANADAVDFPPKLKLEESEVPNRPGFGGGEIWSEEDGRFERGREMDWIER